MEKLAGKTRFVATRVVPALGGKKAAHHRIVDVIPGYSSLSSVVDLRIQEIPTAISTGLSFRVYTWEQLQKLINGLPEGTTPKRKGGIIPFVRVQLEIGNMPVVLSIKRCAHPHCKMLFLSAGPNHRKCHRYHKHPIEKLY